MEENEKLDSFNGNEEEFQKFRKDLDDTRSTANKFNEMDYSIYVNKTMEGRVILLYENGNIKYDGYCKDGKYDGFGKSFEKDGQLIYEGFFQNYKYNGKGILYKDNKKIYEGEFKDNKYHGIGIEYDSNGIKAKSFYSNGERVGENIKIEENKEIYYENPKEGKNISIYSKENKKDLLYKGDISNYKYNGKGKLYDDGELLFDGIFENGNYKEGILYTKDKSKIYEGQFNDNKYEGNGLLYYEIDNKVYYKGSFLKGDFVNGILYDLNGKIIYKGEFSNNMPKNCKKIKLPQRNGKIIYEGNIVNFCFEGKMQIYYERNKELIFEGTLDGNNNKIKGILYKDNKKKYEGEFKNDEFNGFGKLYETDKENNLYLYYEGSFKDNFAFGKGVKYYKNGSKKIEGIFSNINSYNGIYYDPKGNIIFQGEITNDILMNSNEIILYNDYGDLIYNSGIYDKKNLFTYENKDSFSLKYEKLKEIPRIRVIFIDNECGCGKGVLGKLTKQTENSILDFEPIFYEYKKQPFRMLLFAPKHSERFSLISPNEYKHVNVFVVTFNISKQENRLYNIEEEEIFESIKKHSTIKEHLIYLLGENFKENTKYIEKYRTRAKSLIDSGKADKYFEIERDSGQGIEEFIEILKIDAAILIQQKTKNLFYEYLSSGSIIKTISLPTMYELTEYLNY